MQAYGYRRGLPGVTTVELAADRAAIMAFAHREDVELAHLFTETDPARPLAAYSELRAAALAERARRNPVAAVIVPGPEHFGGGAPGPAAVLRQRLERELDLEVLFVPAGLLRAVRAATSAAATSPARRSEPERAPAAAWARLAVARR